MDLWDMLKVAGQQWRVLVPLLVLTFATALFVGAAIDPEYTAGGSLVLVGPNEIAGAPAQPAAQPGEVGTPAGAPTPVNPYLGFSSSLPVTAQALALRVNSNQTKDALQSSDLSTSYEVTPDPRSPIVRVVARGQNPEQAVATLNLLIDVAGEELLRLQTTRDAPESQLINLDVLDQSTSATADTGGRTKLRLMIIGLGVAGSITAAYLAEGILAWRRERQPAGGGHGRHSGGYDDGHDDGDWDNDDGRGRHDGRDDQQAWEPPPAPGHFGPPAPSPVRRHAGDPDGGNGDREPWNAPWATQSSR